MSVSQVKKRFGEFESYLRNDKEGLRRLKLLKDDVNVLRTDLASAMEAKETAEVIKDAARDRADAADEERDALRLEIHSLRQKVASLMADLASATKPDEPLVESDDPERLIEVGEYAEARRTVKALRNVMPHCPKMLGDGKVHLRNRSIPQFYLRHKIAAGWSHNAMWRLGASVALIAAENGQVTVLDPIGIDGLGRDDQRLDGFAFNFLTWFQHNVGMISTREKKRNPLAVVWGDKTGDAERTAEFLYGE